MNHKEIEERVTLIEYPNGGKDLNVDGRTILRISSPKDNKVVIYVESGEDLKITRPPAISKPKSPRFTPEIDEEGFLELVEAFRTLKRWRDEKKIPLEE